MYRKLARSGLTSVAFGALMVALTSGQANALASYTLEIDRVSDTVAVLNAPYIPSSHIITRFTLVDVATLATGVESGGFEDGSDMLIDGVAPVSWSLDAAEDDLVVSMGEAVTLDNSQTGSLIVQLTAGVWAAVGASNAFTTDADGYYDYWKMNGSTLTEEDLGLAVSTVPVPAAGVLLAGALALLGGLRARRRPAA